MVFEQSRASARLQKSVPGLLAQFHNLTDQTITRSLPLSWEVTTPLSMTTRTYTPRRVPSGNSLLCKDTTSLSIDVVDVVAPRVPLSERKYSVWSHSCQTL